MRLPIFWVLIGIFSLAVLAPFHADPVHASTAPRYRLVPTAAASAVPSLRETAKNTCRKTANAAHSQDGQASLSLNIDILDATGNAVANNSLFTLPKIPYTLTYKITLTNTGNAAMPKASTVAFTTYTYVDLFAAALPNTFDRHSKTKNLSLPVLQPGGSKVYSLPVTYTGGGTYTTGTLIDPTCSLNADYALGETRTTLTLLTSGSDLSYGLTLATQSGGSVQAEVGRPRSGQPFNIDYILGNTGTVTPDHDVSVTLTSPLIGKKITATIAKANLPKSGNYSGYEIVDDTETPVIFTAPTVTQEKMYPLAVSINPGRAPTEDTYTNNTYKDHIHIVPIGTDIAVTDFSASCPLFTGMTSVSFTLQNKGTAAITTPFSVQLYVDGKMSGAPVPGGTYDIQQSQTLDFSVSLSKPGTHTFKLVVDAPHALHEYTTSNNIFVVKRQVLGA